MDLTVLVGKSYKPTLTRLFCLVVIAGWVCNALAKKPLTAVADPRFGVALYHYYQDNYLPALSELLVAEQKGGIQGHGDNPKIMEGGFSLAYGMEGHAGAIFEDLLAGNRSPKVQDAAWFYLARLRYLRRDWLSAQTAIEKIRPKPSRKLRNDLSTLKINLAIQTNKLTEAETLLKQHRPKGGWLPYVYFNLGSAYSRAGQFSQALPYYNRLLDMGLKEEEHLTLYDKAMTAAGYSLLLDKRYSQAKQQFSRVRLESHFANRALLGFGWAAAEEGNYREALKPWIELSKRPLVDENTQEALLAVPYAYEKLGIKGEALREFQYAEKNFEQEIARINDVLDNIQGEAMLEALDITQSRDINWASYAGKNQLTPQLTYLTQLFSHEEFQRLVSELRDLLAMQAQMREWLDKLDFYREMLDEREVNRGRQVDQLERQAQTEVIQLMLEQRQVLADKIQKIVNDKDYFALSSGDEADLIRRVTQLSKNIDLVKDSDSFVDEYRESYRRYYGLLLWQASEKFSERLWEVRKNLRVLDKALADVGINSQKVLDVVNRAPDLGPYRAQIAKHKARLEQLNASVDSAVENAQQQLQGQVTSVLAKQRSRLQHYLSQSRLAIARLYDSERQEDIEAERSEGETTP